MAFGTMEAVEYVRYVDRAGKVRNLLPTRNKKAATTMLRDEMQKGTSPHLSPCVSPELQTSQ